MKRHLAHFNGMKENPCLSPINTINAGIPHKANMRLVEIVNAANNPKHLNCFRKSFNLKNQPQNDYVRSAICQESNDRREISNEPRRGCE